MHISEKLTNTLIAFRCKGLVILPFDRQQKFVDIRISSSEEELSFIIDSILYEQESNLEYVSSLLRNFKSGEFQYPQLEQDIIFKGVINSLDLAYERFSVNEVKITEKMLEDISHMHESILLKRSITLNSKSMRGYPVEIIKPSEEDYDERFPVIRLTTFKSIGAYFENQKNR